MVRKVFLRRHLTIRSKYLKKVLSCKVGDVFRTVRLGYVVPKAKEVYIHSAGKVVAKGEIVNVIYKKVGELTDEDARLDGFRSREELIKELKKIYGSLSSDDVVTILEIKVLEYLNVDEAPTKLSPVDIARLALHYNIPLSDEERKILEQLIRCGSLRKLAIELYGTIGKRWRIRKVVRKVLKLLIERNIIGSEQQIQNKQSNK